MIITTLILAVAALLLYLFMQQDVFGADPADTRLARIHQSKNYRDGAFQNLSPTAVMAKGVPVTRMVSDYLNKSKINTPAEPLPSVKTNLATLSDRVPTLVWFGHSSYLIKANGLSFLIDPVFSGYASPVSFFGGSFPGSDVYSVADMPAIDFLILSHDHYDHLDYTTIVALIPRVKMFYTALGVGAHLERWGVPADRIVEFDWWEGGEIAPGVRLTATPARHFSGRSLARGRTLWTSYVLKLPGYSLYLGGDSGYDTHFKAIGEKYGPFDLAILECGQYNETWPSIHMMPEEVVTAAQELRAKTLLPVHWGKFALAYHAWNEPIERVTKRAAELQVDITTPRIGEPVQVGLPYPRDIWWNSQTKTNPKVLSENE
ncbi:MBL fold metallo-hydrolase [Spirosoma utsteinense]|uniref:L-ascorbate metabolism protein UlaG (Beta-lactamase superfamily) n=1 Tax=Spirosoma utsteinense TaxID=2585773 RepID=A0ABR6W658_9BACT|nr:MBL fold metallo-hydrolase [Spirosoma utsteinense]MBC3785858.1 L-ascorbate metabolism protein UlaG (beta-lactamase superfamily) [Spirosoma utsteinense]MBC3792030.1 L-ascorbate metabolism protein UlaG (beta-lactamase superfamily) [Spirosoma utsteinense]